MSSSLSAAPEDTAKPTSQWQPFTDEGSGQTYYYNVVTGESRWTAPGWLQVNEGVWQHEDTMETRHTDPDWQVFFDATYEAPYWYNASTGERTWEKPEFAIAANAEPSVAARLTTNRSRASSTLDTGGGEAASDGAGSAGSACNTGPNSAGTSRSSSPLGGAAASGEDGLRSSSGSGRPKSTAVRDVSTLVEAQATYRRSVARRSTRVKPGLTFAKLGATTKGAAVAAGRAMQLSIRGMIPQQQLPETSGTSALPTVSQPQRAGEGTRPPTPTLHLHDIVAQPAGGAAQLKGLQGPLCLPVVPACLHSLAEEAQRLEAADTAAAAAAGRPLAAASLSLGGGHASGSQPPAGGAGSMAARAAVPVPSLLECHSRAMGEYKRRFLTHTALSKLALFKGVTPVEARSLAGAFSLWACPSGTAVATEGDLQDCLVLVAKGSLRLYSAGEHRRELADAAAAAAAARQAAEEEGEDEDPAALARRAAARAAFARAHPAPGSPGAGPDPLTGIQRVGSGLLPWVDLRTRGHTEGDAATRVAVGLAGPGAVLGADGLVAANQRSSWTAVSIASATSATAAAAAAAGGAAGTSGATAPSAGAAVPGTFTYTAAGAAAIDQLTVSCGGCHLLVLSEAALRMAMGHEWLLRRKRAVLTGVHGIGFAGRAHNVWSATQASAAYSSAACSGNVTSAALMRGSAAAAAGVEAAELVGATAGSDIGLISLDATAQRHLALFLSDVPYLSGLRQGHALESFARHSVLLRRPAHAILALEDAPADAFFVVLHGSVRVSARGGQYLLGAGPGFHFGEQSLLRGGAPNAATVVTSSDVLLLATPRPAWERFAKRHAGMREAFGGRLGALVDALPPWRALRYFACMSDPQLATLAAGARCVRLGFGSKLSLTRRTHDGCYLVAEGSMSVAIEDCLTTAGPGRLIGLHNLCATSLCDAVVGESDAETGIHMAVTSDSALLVRLTRADLLRIVGGAADAPPAAVGNLDAAVSLWAALAAEARAAAAAEGAAAIAGGDGSGAAAAAAARAAAATSDGSWGVTVGDDSALYDVATASVIGRCKRFQAIVDANIQLDPSISGAVSAAIAACDAWTQRAMALSPFGAPILAVPRPLLAAAQEIRRRYIGPSAEYPEVRDRLNPAVCGLISALLGPEVAPAGAGGGSGGGGADGTASGDGGGAGGGSGGEAVGPLPPTLFLDVLGCLDFELAPCIEEFRGSIALRTVLQAIVDAAPTLASIGALPGGAGTGGSAGGSAAGLIGLSAGFGGDASGMAAAAAAAAAAVGSAGAAIAFLDADPRAGLVGSISETTVKRGMVARFHAAKLNRYHRWQPRIFTIRLDTADVMVHEVAGEGSHRFRLSSIQQAERITKDLTAKQLKITFNRAAVGPDLTDKEYQLRFEDNATRETFCTLLHLLEPDVPVTDDSLHFLGGGRVAYDVLLLTRGGVKQRRVLTLDTRQRLLSRSRPDPAQGDWKAAATAAAASSAAGGGGGGGAGGPGAGMGGVGAASGGDTDDEDEGHGSGGAGHRHAASASTSAAASAAAAAAAAGQQRDLPITVSTRLEPSPLDPTRLKLLFGGAGEASSETFEVCFPCHAAREHFAGTLRTLTYNVDTAAARVLGVHRAGIAPDVLTVWVGTFNCGETRPPKDLASLGAWVPAHRYDVLAIGLQECNARDEWVRAFEWLLATANAPAAGAEPPPLARFCAPPGPPSRDAGSGGGGGGGSAHAQVVGWGDGDDEDGAYPGGAASGGGAPGSGGKGGGSGGKGVKRIFSSMFGGSRGAGSVAGSFSAATTAAVAAVLATASSTMTSASQPLQSAPGASPFGVPSQPSFAFAAANPAFGSGGGGGGTRPASVTYSAGGGSFAVPSTSLSGPGGAASGRRGANSTGKEGGGEEEGGYGAVGASYTRAQLGMREPTELIGFSREVLTGVIHAPAAHSRSISMGSINAASIKRAAAAAGAGAEGGGGAGGHLSGSAGASSTRVSSKASRMLGFGGGGGGGGGAGGGGGGSGLPGRDKEGAGGAATGVAGSERVIHSSMLTPAASAAGGGAGGEGGGGSGRTSRPDPPVAVSPYVTVSVTTLWGIHLLLFARASVAQHISQVQSGTAATGIGGVLGNKGGVATGLVYRESTSIAFVTSHLAARAERVRERGDDYSEICRALRLSTSPFAGQFLHQYDHVLWCGDLNYRTDMGAMGSADEFHRVQAAIAARDWALLTAADQLGRELESGRIFQGFSEGRIAFAPTYRMEKGRDEYSNKKNQNASYTDRVLWRSRAGLQANVAQLHYDACYAVNQSDHRPVGAGFLLAATLPYMCLQRSDIGERGSGISGGSGGGGPGGAAAATPSAAAPSSAAAAAGGAAAAAAGAAGPSSGAGGIMGPAAAAILNRGGCALNVSYLRYDDVVLGRGEQIAAEAGLDVSAAIEGVQRTRHKAVLASILAVTASQQAAAGGAVGGAAGEGGGPSESSPVNRGTSGSSGGGITASDWGVPLSPGAGGGEGWGPDEDGGGKASNSARARSAGALSASPGTAGGGSGGSSSSSSMPALVTVTAGRLAFPSGATALPPYLARSIAAAGGSAAAGAGGSAASVSATATAASAALAAATSTVSGASGVNPDSYYCEIGAPWLEEGVSTGFGVAAPTGAAAAAAVASYLGSAGFGGASGAGGPGAAGGAADGAAAGGAAASAGAGGSGALSVSNPALAAAVAGSAALTALASVGEAAAAAAAAAAGGSAVPGVGASAAAASAAQALGPYGGVAGLAASGGGSMAAALAAAAPSNLGSVSAQWLPEAIPDMVAALPEPKWLAGQVLRISLKRRGGTLIGQADVSLRDAFLCSEAELPLAPEALTLHAVMEHPVLASMFGAFTASNLSSESLDFYRSHLAFQELCSAGPHVATAEVRIAAAHVICDTFLWSTAPRMVSVSGTLIAKLKTALAKADEAYGIVSVTLAGGGLASAHSSASLLGLPSGVGGGVSSPPGSTRRLLGGLGGSGRNLTAVGDSLPGFTAGASGAALAAPVKGGLPAAGMAATPEEAAALVERYAPSDLLHEAAVEVFRAMERDNLPGFRQLYSRVVAACGLHYGAVPASASAAAAAAAAAGSAASAAPAGPTTPCAPFCVPLLRDGCTVGVLRGALQLTPQDVLGDRVQRLKELHRFLRRRSTVAAARRNTAAGGGDGGAAAGRGGAAGGGGAQRGVVGGMLIEDGMALPGGGGGGGGSSAGGRSSIVPGSGSSGLGGRGGGGPGGVATAGGSSSGGSGGGGLVLNSMATYTRLPAGEQSRVRSAVDHLLGPVVAAAAPGGAASVGGTGAAGGQGGGGAGAGGASVPSSSLPAPPGTEAGDDFLLLADVLLGAAVAERDALPSSAAAGSHGEAQAQAAVLARAAAMATAASGGDASIPTRALRSLLQLALQRVNALEEQLHGTPLQAQTQQQTQQQAAHHEASRADRW